MQNLKKNRLLWFVFIVLIFLALVIVASWLQYQDPGTSSLPNQNIEIPVLDKNVISDDEFGFELTYPESWFYSRKSGGGLTPLGIFFSNDQQYVDTGRLSPNQPSPDKYVNFVIYVTDQTIEQYSSSDLKSKKLNLLSSNDVSVSGLDGLKTKSTNSQGTFLSVYVKKNDHLYIFETLIKNENDVSDVESVVDNMVSSFKFNN